MTILNLLDLPVFLSLIYFSYHFPSSPLGLYFYILLTISFSVLLRLALLSLALIQNSYLHAHTFHFCGSFSPDWVTYVLVNREGGEADSREKPSVLRISRLVQVCLRMLQVLHPNLTLWSSCQNLLGKP